MERLEERLAFSVAYGDFDGDGFQDMVVGVPGEGVASVHPSGDEVIRAGAIHVVMGGPLADSTVDERFFHQRGGNNLDDPHVIADFAEEDDRFGAALAVGDFNGDGRDDLAIGVPGEDIRGVVNAGAVNIIYGSADGLTLEGNLVLHQDTLGMAEEAEDNDRFGSVLSSGDFNGDGVDDLAIGVPNENLRTSPDQINARVNAGLVHIVSGRQDVGLVVEGNKTFDEGLLRGQDQVEHLDNFGAALASADFNGDGADDLAIGVPGEDVGTLRDAGAVNLVYGSTGIGLTVDANRYYHNDDSDVVGSAQSFANFGATLAAGNFDGDDFFDLAIGAVNHDGPGNDNAGAVNILFGRNGYHGFDGLRAQHWHQSMLQIEGDGEAEDHFGGALAAGDFNGDGKDDLAIGIPGKDFDNSGSLIVGNAGSVLVLFADTDGSDLMASNQKSFAQYMTELEDDIDVNDYFGAQLAAGDMTGDGVADLAIGVSGEDMQGAVHVIPGLQDSYEFQGAWDKLWSQDSIGVSDQGEIDDLFGGQLSAWIGPQYVTSGIIPEEAFFLHSNPSAPFTLFLDFTGGWSPNHKTDESGSSHETPGFDVDGNDTYFSRTELDVMEHVWAMVSEDFAPFNVNVTTDQGYFIPGQHFRVLIGGDGSERGFDPEGGTRGWAGNQPFGGDVFLHNDRPSDVFVFAEKYGLGNLAVNLAFTASHEAAHALGLHHQNEVDENGQVLDVDGVDGIDVGEGCSGGDAYGNGPEHWSPIMGNDSSARTIWAEEGEFISPGRFINVVDDCGAQAGGVIELLTSGLGAIADDHGGLPPKETSLGVLTTNLVGTGTISTLGDVDRFTFEVATAGIVNIDVSIADTSPNLDARLRLIDDNGAYDALSDDNLNEAIDRYLEPGTYTVEVSSQAIMQGDLGQYSVRISRPDGHLVVLGTSGDDNILILQSPSDPTQLEVNVNGDITNHRLAAIRSITVYAKGGHDVISIQDLPDSLLLNGNAETIELTLDVHSGYGNDDVVLSKLGAGVEVTVNGSNGNDILWLGGGDLGTIQADVRYFGGVGNDAMKLNDTTAASGRDYHFDRSDDAGIVIAENAGQFRFEDDVEDIRLDASNHKDQVNVEALSDQTTLEMYGHGARDTFSIAEVSRSLAEVAGDVIIHGGSGKILDATTFEEFDKWVPEDGDRVYVYDTSNPAAGEYEIDATGLITDYEFLGTMTRSQLEEDINGTIRMTEVFRVQYDEIEDTRLFADKAQNQIDVNAAPRFNAHSIFAHQGDDTINVVSTPVDGPLHVYGQRGGDIILVSSSGQLGRIKSAVHVDGGDVDNATDLLVIDDANASTVNYTLQLAEFHTASPDQLGPDSLKAVYAGIENLNIQLNDHDNNIDVLSTAADTPVGINGWEGSDTITMSTASSPVTFAGGADGSGSDLDRAFWIGTEADDSFAVAGNTIYRGNGSLTTDNEVEMREVIGAGGIDLLRIEGVAGFNELIHIRPDGLTPYQGQVEVGNWQPVRYRLEDLAVAGNADAQDDDRLRFDGPTDVEENYFHINFGAHGTHKSPLAIVSTAEGERLRLRSASGLDSDGSFATPAIAIHAPAQYGEFNVIAPDGSPEEERIAVSVYGDGLWADLNVTSTTGAEVVHQVPDDAIPGQVLVDYENRGYDVAYYGINNVTFDEFLPGDFDGNGVIDDGDFKVWDANFGQTVDPYTDGDANGDGKVDIEDWTILKDNQGTALPKPENAPAAALASYSASSNYVDHPALDLALAAWDEGEQETQALTDETAVSTAASPSRELPRVRSTRSGYAPPRRLPQSRPVDDAMSKHAWSLDELFSELGR